MFSGLVGLDVVAALPAEHEIGLLLHGHVGIGAGVDENVGFGFHIVDQVVLEERPVFRGHVFKGAALAAVGGHGGIAAVEDPFAIRLHAAASAEHHVLVVAADELGLVLAGELHKAFEDAGGFRAAVDVIPQKDELIGLCRRNCTQQCI